MKFEWDERKNRSNVEKHGFDFRDAHEIFQGPLLVRADVKEHYGEERWRGIGMVGGRPVVVAFVERAPEVIRIISLRKATRREVQAYLKVIGN